MGAVKNRDRVTAKSLQQSSFDGVWHTAIAGVRQRARRTELGALDSAAMCRSFNLRGEISEYVAELAAGKALETPSRDAPLTFNA